MTIRFKKKFLTLFLLLPGFLQAGNFPVADEVIIDKSDRELHLLSDGEIFRTFKIALVFDRTATRRRKATSKHPKASIVSMYETPTVSTFCRSMCPIQVRRIDAKPVKTVWTRADRS